MSGFIGGDDFRSLMRHIPSPVMVLTYENESGPRGVTIGSFASVSLDPPLISFNLMRSGSSSEDIQGVSCFAIHVLRNDQSRLSEHFAQPDLSSGVQFKDIDYIYSSEGVPVMDDCLAFMICELFDIVTAGDHSLVLGKVLRADVVTPSKPLLYFQRSYHEVGDSM
ncbi:MAG: flavin reductase family protein [Rhodothermaceae bacterium]|nr:flavin reductase family protein [Rhodothermaceae bacterium]